MVPAIVTGSALGGSAGQAGASPQGLGDLKKDFDRFTEHHGDPVGFEKAVSGPGSKSTATFSSGRGNANGRSAKKVNPRANKGVDVFTFEDGTESTVSYLRTGSNRIIVKWNGDVYHSRSADELEQRLLQESEQELSTATSRANQSTEKHGEHSAGVGVGTAHSGGKVATSSGTGHSKEFIETVDSLPDGSSDDSGILGGLSKTRSRHATDECYSLVESAGAARGWAKSEVYTSVDLDELSYGSLAQIEAEGRYRGSVGSGLTAGHAKASVFIREPGGSDVEKEEFLDLSLGLIDSWGAHTVYDTTMYSELDPGTYEVGIRLSLSGKNLGISAAVMDFYTFKNLDTQLLRGFVDNTYISIFER